MSFEKGRAPRLWGGVSPDVGLPLKSGRGRVKTVNGPEIEKGLKAERVDYRLPGEPVTDALLVSLSDKWSTETGCTVMIDGYGVYNIQPDGIRYVNGAYPKHLKTDDGYVLLTASP